MIDSLRNLIYMGGYGSYVWSSYAIGLAVLAGLWLFARQSKIRALKRVAEVIRQENAE